MSGFRLSCPNLHIFSSKSLKDKKHAVISSAGSNFILLAQQKTVISLCDTQVHLHLNKYRQLKAAGVRLPKQGDLSANVQQV